MNSTAIHCVFEGNADISGTGIRVSLYILALVGPVVSRLLGSSELAKAIDSALGLQGLALFLTAVINSARRSITLFHALCLFHLLCLVGISVTPSGQYDLSLVRMWVSSSLYFLAMWGFLGSAIYVFATAPTYGDQPQCNASTLYVIFGANIHATSPVLRWIFVSILSAVLLVFVLFAIVSTGMMAFMAWFSRFAGTQTRFKAGSGSEKASKDEAEGFPWPLVGRLGASAYIIAMLELIIKRNQPRPQETLWTFGQVLAMMMLLGPLIECLSLVLGKMDIVHAAADPPAEEVADNHGNTTTTESDASPDGVKSPGNVVRVESMT